MDRGSMKVNYDPESDIFYMIIKEGPIKDTIEADNDIFLEIAEDESLAGIEILNELPQQSISSGSIYVKSIGFSKSPIVVNTVLAENGDEIRIPPVTVPQIKAENAIPCLYFKNLYTQQSTAFGFYKKIGNGTVYFVLTDPILSAIENLSDSNIHLLESMFNLMMNAFNLSIPSHVSHMKTFPDYDTVDGNIILNGNATIISNYMGSTEQILTGTVKIKSENISVEFRDSTIKSLRVYGGATLLVNDSSAVLSISGPPSAVILNSNESAQYAVILSSKTKVELNIEDSIGESHNITVEDGAIYFNSNKLALLLENPMVKVNGDILFESHTIHIAPYTLLAGTLENAYIRGYCAFKIVYSSGGSALIPNFEYKGTAAKIPCPSKQELEIPWMKVFLSPLNVLTIICLAILFAVSEVRKSGTASLLHVKRQGKDVKGSGVSYNSS